MDKTTPNVQEDEGSPNPYAEAIEVSPSRMPSLNAGQFRRALGLLLASEIGGRHPEDTERGILFTLAAVEALGPACDFEQYQACVSRMMSLITMLAFDDRLKGFVDEEASTWEELVDADLVDYFARLPLPPVNMLEDDDHSLLSLFAGAAWQDAYGETKDDFPPHIFKDLLFEGCEEKLGEPLPPVEPAGAHLPAVPTGKAWLDDAVEKLTVLQVAAVIARQQEHYRRLKGRNPVTASARLVRAYRYSVYVDSYLEKLLGVLDSPEPPPDLGIPDVEFNETIQEIRRSRPTYGPQFREQVRETFNSSALFGVSLEDLPKDVSRQSSGGRKETARGVLSDAVRFASPVSMVGLRLYHQIYRDTEGLEIEIDKDVISAVGISSEAADDVLARMEALGYVLGDPRARHWMTEKGEPVIPLLCAVSLLDFSMCQTVRNLVDWVYGFLDETMADEERLGRLHDHVLENIFSYNLYPYANDEETIGVTLRPTMELVDVKLSPAIVDPEKIDVLEDALCSALTACAEEIREDLRTIDEQFERRPRKSSAGKKRRKGGKKSRRKSKKRRGRQFDST